MTTTKRPDPSHPVERARREVKRGRPGELAAMREAIASALGFRIDTNRLDPEESGELLALHTRCVEAEGWETGNFRNYGLHKLEPAETARWRALVSKAMGHEGLLDDLDEDASAVQRIRELAARALRPLPTQTAAPQGAVVLPGGVWEDVLQDRLLMLDVSVLAAVCFLFQGGEIHPQTRRRKDAIWGPDETLIVRDGLHRLLPGWTQTIEYYGDAVAVDRQGIERRLGETGWLEIERHGPHEITVRLGPRFGEGSGSRAE
jgi:hypothetical protein